MPDPRPLLFGHPFSSYTQKALIACYENAVAFRFHLLDHTRPETLQDFARRWPVQRFPILVDGDTTILEATTIIEWLQATQPGPVRLVPDDPLAAVQVRMLDRVFDNYVSGPQQAIVFDSLRPPADRDTFGVRQARERLDTSCAWLETQLADGRTWATGETFTLADCAAGPALFYADWTHPFAGRFPALAAYRERLKTRPSFARAIGEAREWRHYFPLDGAPLDE